jgi:hypothetical protein
MAYDSVRGVTVMYGGIGPNNLVLGDTWEWDGATWTERALGGPRPPAARGAKMIFNSKGKVCVMLVNNQTWEWNGEAWSLRSLAGPTPIRTGYSMAYDPVGDRIILFGGRFLSNGAFIHPGETWEWNGARWLQVAAKGPTGRAGAAMAYDPARQRIVMFGGHTAFARGGVFLTHIAQTWEWDGEAWELRSSSGPTPRSFHAMAYSTVRGRVLVFGGETYGIDSACWEWDGTSWSILHLDGAAARSHHEMVDDLARGVMVSFGGHDGATTRGETLELLLNSTPPHWTTIDTSAVPSPRAHAAMVYDRARGVTVLFGGATLTNTGAPVYVFGDTWEWNGQRWHLRATDGPAPRCAAAIAYDEQRGVPYCLAAAMPPTS